MRISRNAIISAVLLLAFSIQAECFDYDSEMRKLAKDNENSKQERVSKVVQCWEDAGLKSGSIFWLKSPKGALPGLQKLVLNDVEAYEGKKDSFDLIVFAEKPDGSAVSFILEHGQFDCSYDRSPSKFYLKFPKDVARWDKRILKAIENHSLIIGMSPDQAFASWGVSLDVNTTVGKWGSHEQWVYGENGKRYLYFQNDRLTSWQY